jgi:integrase/recombinase XerD
MNFSTAVDGFLTHCAIERNLSEKSLKAYRIDLAQFKTFLGEFLGQGEVLPADIGRDVLREYLQKLTAQFKVKTVRRKIAVLHSLFTFFEQEDIIVVSPFRKMRISLNKEKVLPRAVAMQKIRKLFLYLYRLNDSEKNNPILLRDIAVLELLFATGIRVSEAVSLCVADVDLRTGSICVMGKGSKERILPICSKETLDLLKEYTCEFREQMQASGSFFVNRDGRRLSAQSVRFMLRKHVVGARLGIHITPHMLRHTVATELVGNGADIRNVQHLLGHSSIMTTQIYTHVDASSARKALTPKHPRKLLNMRIT